MLFTWTPEMKVDDGQIDGDHQELIAIANRMFNFKNPNREAEEIKQVIRELYDYVNFHFTREEAFMTKIGYPQKEAHMEKHAIIITEMNQQLTSAHHMGEILGSFKALVNRWILDHIMEEDMQIKHFLANRPEAAS